MNIFETLFLGVVEGVTEFLPISSTFHLLWSSYVLTIPETDFVKLFQVVIQAGAIMAVVVLYAREICNNRTLQKLLLASFIPTAVVAVLLYPLIKSVFFEALGITTSIFALVGGFFLLLEYAIEHKYLKLEKTISVLTYKHAVIIGLCQAFAVVPGVSRAGAVLAAMMMMGYRRDESAKYSFLLSIPTIVSAALFDLYKMRGVALADSAQTITLLLGTIIAFVSALVGVKWLIGYLQQKSLNIFGWYRLLLGIILLLVLFARGL
ncbi:undecaprenyl-diphosphate phosphatase [Candidatus Woesebacteria bacterium]|nr:undecaprenyl-diphosphate phosphatase [Candidatus Woesebacteria bacterium]